MNHATTNDDRDDLLPDLNETDCVLSETDTADYCFSAGGFTLH